MTALVGGGVFLDFDSVAFELAFVLRTGCWCTSVGELARLSPLPAAAGLFALLCCPLFGCAQVVGDVRRHTRLPFVFGLSGPCARHVRLVYRGERTVSSDVDEFFFV